MVNLPLEIINTFFKLWLSWNGKLINGYTYFHHKITDIFNDDDDNEPKFNA